MFFLRRRPTFSLPPFLSQVFAEILLVALDVLARLNSMLSHFHLLDSVSEFFPSYLSLLPPFLGILFVSDFGQDLLVHSCIPPGTVVFDFCLIGMHDS